MEHGKPNVLVFSIDVEETNQRGKNVIHSWLIFNKIQWECFCVTAGKISRLLSVFTCGHSDYELKPFLCLLQSVTGYFQRLIIQIFSEQHPSSLGSAGSVSQLQSSLQKGLKTQMVPVPAARSKCQHKHAHGNTHLFIFYLVNYINA